MKTTLRQTITAGTALFLAILPWLPHQAAKPATSPTGRPNVVVIVADDAGYADFGFMGSKDLKTPQIDQMAKDGVVFNDAHVVATVCAPSRAGLVTGQYPQRFGFEANGTGNAEVGDLGLGDQVLTLADIFRRNGYKTYALGKWPQAQNPDRRGLGLLHPPITTL